MSNCKFKLHRRRAGKKVKLPQHEECDCGNYHKACKVLVAFMHTKKLFIVLVARVGPKNAVVTWDKQQRQRQGRTFIQRQEQWWQWQLQGSASVNGSSDELVRFMDHN